MLFFRKSPSVSSETCAELYRKIVGYARREVFYLDLGVPDTVDGRFDVICLHMYLLMRKLKDIGTPESSALSQALFDRMFADMDASLRQMGVSDMKVGKEVKAMAKAFYGRIEAYDHGLDVALDRLEVSVQRNLYRSEGKIFAARAVAEYMQAAYDALKQSPDGDILSGVIRFPDILADNNQVE